MIGDERRTRSRADLRSELEAIHVAIDMEVDGFLDVAEWGRDRLVEVEDAADSMLGKPAGPVLATFRVAVRSAATGTGSAIGI